MPTKGEMSAVKNDPDNVAHENLRENPSAYTQSMEKKLGPLETRITVVHARGPVGVLGVHYTDGHEDRKLPENEGQIYDQQGKNLQHKIDHRRWCV
jgi:hypothetical protein